MSHFQKSDGKVSRWIKYKDLDIGIETDKGQKRLWFDKDTGKSGITTMKFPYGFFKGHKGADGDSLDVFVGPDLDTDDVYVVKQVKPMTGVFDEYKVMIGFESERQAKNAYLMHYEDESYFDSIKTYPYSQFKSKFLSGSAINKSLEDEKESVDSEENYEMDYNDPQVVEHLNDIFEKLTEEQIKNIARDIWGSDNIQENSHPVLLRAEVKGFLMDQENLVSLATSHEDEIVPKLQMKGKTRAFTENPSQWSPELYNYVTHLRQQLDLPPLEESQG
jgi:hypothetical protein